VIWLTKLTKLTARLSVTAEAVEAVLDLIRDHVNDSFYGSCEECSYRARQAEGFTWPSSPPVPWPCDFIKDIARRAAGAEVG
jgi:hypothetical protein